MKPSAYIEQIDVEWGEQFEMGWQDKILVIVGDEEESRLLRLTILRMPS